MLGPGRQPRQWPTRRSIFSRGKTRILNKFCSLQHYYATPQRQCAAHTRSAIRITGSVRSHTLYQRLYDAARWSTLIQSFRLAIYHLSTLPTEPLLHLALYGGLASLKLPACYEHETKNVDCPVCDPGLGRLAQEVPFGHHVNSTIVCRITGRIMDADNMPMAFPQNGQVYSKEVCLRYSIIFSTAFLSAVLTSYQALEEIAANNDGIVTCPKTRETCKFSELRRVFIS